VGFGVYLMNDLSNYCSQAQEIKELKSLLRKSEAENKKLTARLDKKKEGMSRQKEMIQPRVINIAYALGRGYLTKQITSDLNVCPATITKVNKQINYKGRK